MKLFNRLNINEYSANYNPENIYCVKTKHITVPSTFQYIGKLKMARKRQYFNRNGNFQSPIILDNPKSMTLVDGWSSLIIAQENKMNTVPVMFVDNGGGYHGR